MILGHWTPLEWLALVEHELLLFAAVFFLIGALDELAMDLAWVWLRLTGRARAGAIDRGESRDAPLAGRRRCSFRPGTKPRSSSARSPTRSPPGRSASCGSTSAAIVNDPATLEAVMRGVGRRSAGAAGGPRSRRADDQGRLPQPALRRARGRRGAQRARFRAGGAARCRGHGRSGRARPARPRARPRPTSCSCRCCPNRSAHSRWIGSHYCDEFAEAHGKAMVVRERAGRGAAGRRAWAAASRARCSARSPARRTTPGPFSVESLTEDYELGLRIGGRRARALPARARRGRAAGGDARVLSRRGSTTRCGRRRAGSTASRCRAGTGSAGAAAPGEWWMRLRDRRGPLTALVLFAGYLLLLLGSAAVARRQPRADAAVAGRSRCWSRCWPPTSSASCGARSMRFAFTAREYGWREGAAGGAAHPGRQHHRDHGRAARAGRLCRARCAARTPRWDKTFHHAHPAAMSPRAERHAPR